jgi:hypothetical protein
MQKSENYMKPLGGAQKHQKTASSGLFLDVRMYILA